MTKIWTDDAWEDYLYWQSQDRKTLKRINQLILDIDRNGYAGIGKPELEHPWPFNEQWIRSRDPVAAALLSDASVRSWLVRQEKL
jgi:Txe/YoeB family toxin of toxin-antitoxin system